MRATSLFLLILIKLHVGLSVSFGHNDCKRSCGKLNGITVPLRFKGDKPECGSAEFELVCEGSEDAVIYIDGHKYFVTEVSSYYYSYSRYITVHVNCPFTASTCRLQDNSSFLVNFSSFSSKNELGFQSRNWVSFISCSQRIESETSYMVVPSLSTDNTTVYVVVGNLANEIVALRESCRFQDTFPFVNGQNFSSSKQVIEMLQNGIQLYWDWDEIGNQTCLTYALRFVFAPLSLCVFLVYHYREDSKPIDTVEKFLQKQEVLTPKRYTYAEIVTMTRHFKEKLGKGGFGSVYKGELLGGRLVAVKVLDSLKFNGEEFISEVATIGRIHHLNIVQLLGFCSEGTKRALIYEYMHNGSLDKYIFSSQDNSRCSLTLENLNDIALGIARGIHYLHSGCDMQILHFDIKPHNILLDYKFTPKVSDFGLARLYPKESSLISISAARGTIGYIAPELVSRNFGIISYKSDVYSFGMLLLEIVGKRRNVDTNVANSSQFYYPSWIYDNLIVPKEPNFDYTVYIGELERKLYKVAFWCIQMNSSNRPSMGEIVEILQTNVDNVQIPPKPFFSTTDAMIEASSTDFVFDGIDNHI